MAFVFKNIRGVQPTTCVIRHPTYARVTMSSDGNDSLFPGKPIEGGKPLSGFVNETLHSSWPEAPRTGIDFRRSCEHWRRPEADRWASALEGGITEQRLGAYLGEKSYFIPSTYRTDRMFLLEPEHALYVQRARMYLDGLIDEYPMRDCLGLWAFPCPLVDFEHRAKRTHARQASRAFGVFLYSREWDLFGKSPADDGRFNEDSRLAVSAHLLPKIDSRLLEAWPSDALPLEPPLMALYFGCQRDNMIPGVAERFDCAVREEFCLISASALYHEAVNSRVLWQLTPKTSSFISDTLSDEEIPPLTRGTGLEPLAISALREIVSRAGDSPAHLFQSRRLGMFFASYAGWDPIQARASRGPKASQVLRPPPGRRVARGRSSAGPSSGGTRYQTVSGAGPSSHHDGYGSSRRVLDTLVRSEDVLDLNGLRNIDHVIHISNQYSWRVSDLIVALRDAFADEYDYAASQADKLTEAEDELKSVAQRRDELQARLNSTEEALGHSKNTVRNLGDELDDAQHERDDLLSERDQLRADYRILESSSETLRNERDRLHKEREDFSEKYDNMRLARENLRGQVAALEARCLALENSTRSRDPIRTTPVSTTVTEQGLPLPAIDSARAGTSQTGSPAAKRRKVMAGTMVSVDPGSLPPKLHEDAPPSAGDKPSVGEDSKDKPSGSK